MHLFGILSDLTCLVTPTQAHFTLLTLRCLLVLIVSLQHVSVSKQGATVMCWAAAPVSACQVTAVWKGEGRYAGGGRGRV